MSECRGGELSWQSISHRGTHAGIYCVHTARVGVGMM